MTSGHALPRSSLLANPVDRAGRTRGGTAALTAAASTAAAAVGIAVAAAGVTLLLRRLSGGFTAVPMAAIPWSVVAGGIPLLVAVEVTARLGGARWPAWLTRGGLVAAALAVAPVTGAMAWPPRAGGLAGTAVALIAALRPPSGWRPPRLHGARPVRHVGDGSLASPEAGGGSSADDRAPSLPPAGGPGVWQPRFADWSAELPAGCRQRLERHETPAGEDCVRGQVMLSVAAGSRTGQAHVGFCPSFATLPAVEVTTHCDFVEAEVAAAEVLPWGVRIECRLSEPAEEPLEIPVAFRAVRPA